MKKQSTYALGALIAGSGLAIITMRPTLAQPGEGRPPHPPGPPMHAIQQLPDLTAEQRTKIEAIMKKSHDEVEAVLTQQQREELDDMREDFGPPPGPFGGGPRGEGPGGFGPPPMDGREGGPRGRGGRDGAGRDGAGRDGRGRGGDRMQGEGRGPGFDGPRGRGPAGRGGPGLPLEREAWMLDLSKDQQRAIKNILSKAQKQQDAIESNTKLSGEEFHTQMRALHDQVREQVLSALSAEQRAKVQEMGGPLMPPPGPRGPRPEDRDRDDRDRARDDR